MLTKKIKEKEESNNCRIYNGKHMVASTDLSDLRRGAFIID